jgi:hypothetical protein
MHSFKTTYGTVPLVEGFRYHFAIRIIKGSNFKLGVSRSRSTLDAAFSDSEDGWAYYSGGQLRHGSKGEGSKYGEAFLDNDVIGVYLDLKDVSTVHTSSLPLGNALLRKESQGIRRGLQFQASADHSKRIAKESRSLCSLSGL